MADADKVIGMMDGAYFTGRKEILEWINETLSIGLTKIEQTATGAIACGLLDAHFPGSVAMSKVNWDCRNEYEYTSNYKTLQAAFNKLNITKKAEIERLARGKYQDNLEFMQWFKGFCSNHSIPESYDAVAARAKGKGASKVAQVFGTAGTEIRTVKARRHQSSGAMGAEQRGPKPVVGGTSSTSSTGTADKENGSGGVESTSTQATSRPLRSSTTNNANSSVATSSNRDSTVKPMTSSTETAQLQREMKTLEKEHSELKMHIDGVEKERDFYFEKLRNIEVMLQELGEKEAAAKGGDAAVAAAATDRLFGHHPSSLAGQIMKVLYEASEDFVAVENPEDAVVGAALMGESV